MVMARKLVSTLKAEALEANTKAVELLEFTQPVRSMIIADCVYSKMFWVVVHFMVFYVVI